MAGTLPNAIFIVVVICTQPTPVKSLIFLFSFCRSLFGMCVSRLSSHTNRSLVVQITMNERKKVWFLFNKVAVRHKLHCNGNLLPFQSESRIQIQYQRDIQHTEMEACKNSHVLVNWWTNHNYMLSRNSETSSTYSLLFFYLFIQQSPIPWCVAYLLSFMRSSRENKNRIFNIFLPVCSEANFNNINKKRKKNNNKTYIDGLSNTLT